MSFLLISEYNTRKLQPVKMFYLSRFDTRTAKIYFLNHLINRGKEPFDDDDDYDNI